MLSALDPLLHALTDGRVIRRYVAVVVDGAAWLTMGAGLIGVIVILKAAFSDVLPAEATIGGVVWALIFAAAVWAMAQVAFYHAREIRRLPDARFVVIPIVSIVLRLGGEVLAVWCTAVGVAGFLLVLVAGQYARALLNVAAAPPGLVQVSGSGLISASGVLAMSLASGFALLLVMYFWSELVLVAADTANHLRQLVSLAGLQQGTRPPGGPVGTAPACPACGATAAEPGTLFCERCGTRL